MLNLTMTQRQIVSWFRSGLLVFISEKLNATVNWDAEKKQATIQQDYTTTIQITLGSDIVKVNGIQTKIDTKAFQSNNRIYVPLRFVSERMYATVEWDNKTNLVTITRPIGKTNSQILSARYNKMGEPFLQTVKLVNGKLEGALTPLPKGYYWGATYRYKDANGKVISVYLNEVYKVGQKFSLPVGTIGSLSATVFKDGTGYGGFHYLVPSMEFTREGE